MINRYQGNSGKVVRIEERSGPRVYAERPRPQPAQPPGHGGGKGASAPARKNQTGLPGGLGIQNILAQLGRLLPGGSGKMAALETEDIILLLILYLMYRESGDSELLMMMGAMFLL